MTKSQKQTPVIVIQGLISDFKTLPTWKKVLLFLPVVLVIIAIAIYLFLNKRDDFAKVVIDAHKDQVDNQLKDLNSRKDEILIKEKTLDQEIKEQTNEIERNEKEARSINDRINGADTFDELRDIHKKLSPK